MRLKGHKLENIKIRSVNKNTSNETLLQIKSLIMDNWGNEYNNITELEKELLLAKNDIGLPNIYYLAEKEEVIAIIGLLEEDLELEEYSQYSPWLANLIVKPAYRLQGIASILCARLLKDAKELGYKEVYLYTHDATDFYTKRNGVVIKELFYNNLNYNLLKLPTHAPVERSIPS
jgi:GNAT superfamily N-acetyltransferase